MSPSNKTNMQKAYYACIPNLEVKPPMLSTVVITGLSDSALFGSNFYMGLKNKINGFIYLIWTKKLNFCVNWYGHKDPQIIILTQAHSADITGVGVG